MRLCTNHKIIFVFIIVFIVYFPSLGGEINSIDDVHIINYYGVDGHASLKDVFQPGGRFYYRPIVELSYLADNVLWGMNPRSMHLENVLLHCLNTILVFLLASEIALLIGGLSPLPLLSGLLFALHPVNIEPIAWIAGRTDPLAAFFIMLSLLFLFKGARGNRTFLVLSIFLLFLSVLVKETSMVLWVVAPLMALRLGRIRKENGDRTHSHALTWYVISTALVASAFCLLVISKIVGTDTAFSMSLNKNPHIALAPLFIFKILGFYVKKLFAPFPLNFATVDISLVYAPVGIVVLGGCIYLLLRRNLFFLFLVSSVLFLIPALAVAVLGVNWTPVAERYLYIPTAFFSIGITGILLQRVPAESRLRLVYTIAAFFVVCGVCTAVLRLRTWKTNLALYEDTARKSNGFGDVHHELGVALRNAGRKDEAKIHLGIAEKAATRPLIREYAALNLLSMDIEGKDPQRKKEILDRFISKQKYVNPEVLRMQRNILHDILTSEKDQEKAQQAMKEIIILNDKLFQEERDPLYLYNNGRVSLALGDKNAGLEYFRRTLQLAPPDAYYFTAAAKLVERLQK